MGNSAAGGLFSVDSQEEVTTLAGGGFRVESNLNSFGFDELASDRGHADGRNS
jgi:hypothetical protein